MFHQIWQLCYTSFMEKNDIVYGVHAVTEALVANTGNKLYIQDDLRGKNVEKIKDLAAEKKVSISWTPKKTLQEMTEGAVHQGFVLRVSEFAYTDLTEILTQVANQDNPLLLILDGLTRVTNLSQTLDKLKEAGFWIFGTDMNGTPSHKWNTSGKLALIIGNEGKGISANIKKQVDEMITIPMQGHVQSLNASVAAAILMYEVFRNKL